jgi:cytochrome P450
MVSFSIAGIHSDPSYYPNPDQFNPDNFAKEARNNRSP